MKRSRIEIAAILTFLILAVFFALSLVSSYANANSPGPICDIQKNEKGRYPRVQHWATKKGIGPWLLKADLTIKCTPPKEVAALQADLIIQRWDRRAERWVNTGNRESEQGKDEVRIWANGICVESGKYRWVLDVDAIGAPGVLNNRAHNVPGPTSKLKCPPMRKP